MDEPGWSWPAWKFGMKREDLFTKLHDQYNTFASSIQDPEAFHHDVYEISTTASTPEEFHRLLSSRREQRLRELNDTLQSASLEIIANPKLIGTQQWQYAIQLFRTRSLDSLVRYFASYLPEDHPWHRSRADAEISTVDASIEHAVDDECANGKPFFDDEDHDFITHEPLIINTSIPTSHLPPSPRSLTTYSDSSSTSPIDVVECDYALNNMTPARTLSFSETESDVMAHSDVFSHSYGDDGETSQSDDMDSLSTSISDLPTADHITEDTNQHSPGGEAVTPAESVDSVSPSVESDVPTPRGEVPEPFVAHQTTKPPRSSRGTSSLYNHVLHEYARSSRKGRRDGSPGWNPRRRSPELGRVQKPQPDPIRCRPMGRRRAD